MIVNRIVNARRRDVAGLWTVRLDAGRIVAIEQQDKQQPTGAPADAGTLDADGGLITPSLVDAHVHLDRAFLTERPDIHETNTLAEARRLWTAVKKTLTAEEVHARTARAIRVEIGYGASLMRCYVDVSAAVGLRLCEGLLKAREETRQICKIQLVAHPAEGLISDPGAADNMRRALKSGVDLVGGDPRAEANPADARRHLEQVFDLAAELTAHVDVIVDRADDPRPDTLELLADVTAERGMQGRVTATNLCALGALASSDAQHLVDKLLASRLSVILLPGMTHYWHARSTVTASARPRFGLARLLDAEVHCAAGQGGIADPLYPTGTGQLLEQAALLVHDEQLSSPEQTKRAYEMVCCRAGDVVGVGCHRVQIDAAANLAIHGAGDVFELLQRLPRPRAVIHAGRLVGGTMCANDPARPGDVK
jgi:cytosine deaminase